MAARPGRDRDDGLADLLIDVLDEPLVEPELLAHFADDPGSLGRDERAGVEAALRESPALRDQLRALQSPEIARVLSEGASPRLAAVPAAAARQGLLERAFDFLRGRGGLVLAPLAAAALLALVFLPILPSAPTPTASPRGEQIAKVERPPPTPAPPKPPVAQVNPPQERPAPPAPPAQIAPQTSKPKPAPAAKPAEPTELAARQPSEADYVAMAEPDYRAPSGAIDHEPEQTFVRGASGGPTAVALAPKHTALTTRAAPELLWYLSELPSPTVPIELVVSSSDGAEVIARRALPAPNDPGLQHADLNALGIELPERRELRWSVVLKLDPENPSRDLRTSGWIERVPESDDLKGRLAAAKPFDRAAVYASSGVWYDAVADLSRVVTLAPEQAQPRLYLERMLERIGLKPGEVSL